MSCNECIHENVCKNVNRTLNCKDFYRKSSTSFPFIAMIEQHLVDGKFVNGNLQNWNGKYCVVYIDKNKWGIPLIDICGKSPYNSEEAEARLEYLKTGEEIPQPAPEPRKPWCDAPRDCGCTVWNFGKVVEGVCDHSCLNYHDGSEEDL